MTWWTGRLWVLFTPNYTLKKTNNICFHREVGELQELLPHWRSMNGCEMEKSTNVWADLLTDSIENMCACSVWLTHAMTVVVIKNRENSLKKLHRFICFSLLTSNSFCYHKGRTLGKVNHCSTIQYRFSCYLSQVDLWDKSSGILVSNKSHFFRHEHEMLNHFKITITFHLLFF